MASKRILPQPPPIEGLTKGGPVAFFLDFDGTLVDIASTPNSICVPSGMARSLERLADKNSGRLAIVSGRSISDLHRHLGPLRLACAGSHGIERLDADGKLVGSSPQAMPGKARDALYSFALKREGLEFEDKCFGAALHFRARPELASEAVAHAEDVASAAGLSIKHGNCVVELLHHGADKSEAVRVFMQLPPFRNATPIFIGDDLTDEDGFRAAKEFGGFGIIVGQREQTSARYRLDIPASVRDWLNL